MFCLPISTFMYLWVVLYIPRIGLHILLQPNRQTNPWEYINHSQIHECRNWEGGRAVSFLGIHKSDFRYSVAHARYQKMGYWPGLGLDGPCWEKVFTWNAQRMVGGGTPFARQDRLTVSPSSATAILADASRLGGTRTFTWECDVKWQNYYPFMLSNKHI